MQRTEQDFIKVVSGGLMTAKSNPIDEIHIAQQGLKAAHIAKFGLEVRWTKAYLAKVIGTSSRSFDRYIKDASKVSFHQGENAIQIARLTSIGTNYFGSVERWNDWLNTPHIQFGGEAPKTIMHTIQGRDLIKRIILGLEHGFAA